MASDWEIDSDYPAPVGRSEDGWEVDIDYQNKAGPSTALTSDWEVDHEYMGSTPSPAEKPTWGETIAGHGAAAGAGIASAVGGGMKFAADVSGPMIPFDLGSVADTTFKYWNKKADEWRPKGETGFQKYAGMAIESTPVMAATIGVGIATGGIGGLAALGAIQGGATYGDDRLNKGRSVIDAFEHTAIDTAAEVIPEAVPLSFILKPGTAILKRMINTYASEMPSEQVTTTIQYLNDYAADNPDVTTSDLWEVFNSPEMAQQHTDTAIVTAILAPFFAGMGHIGAGGPKEAPEPEVEPTDTNIQSLETDTTTEASPEWLDLRGQFDRGEISGTEFAAAEAALGDAPAAVAPEISDGAFLDALDEVGLTENEVARIVDADPGDGPDVVGGGGGDDGDGAGAPGGAVDPAIDQATTDAVGRALYELRKPPNDPKAIASDDPPITMIRKLGGIKPTDPLANDLRMATGTEKNELHIFRKDGQAIDDMVRSVNQYLGPDEQLTDFNDLNEWLGDSIARGETSKANYETPDDRMRRKEAEHYAAQEEGVGADEYTWDDVNAIKEDDLPLLSVGKGKPVRETRIPVPDTTFSILGVKKGNVFADGQALYDKHPEHFDSPADLIDHIEYVLEAPTHKFPGFDDNHRLLVRQNGRDKAVAIQIVFKGGKYRVKSAYNLEAGQLAIKMQKVADKEKAARRDGRGVHRSGEFLDGEVSFPGSGQSHELASAEQRREEKQSDPSPDSNITPPDKKSNGDEPLLSVGRQRTKGKAAMEKVIAEKTDVQNAMHRKGVGPISFLYGESGDPKKDYAGGWGISHIIAKRTSEGFDGHEVARQMVETLSRGNIGKPYGPPGGERVNIDFGEYRAVLSKYRNWKEDVWLVTGWEKTKAPGASGRFDGLAGATHGGPTLTRPAMGAGASDTNIPPVDEESNTSDPTLAKGKKKGDTGGKEKNSNELEHLPGEPGRQSEGELLGGGFTKDDSRTAQFIARESGIPAAATAEQQLQAEEVARAFGLKIRWFSHTDPTFRGVLDSENNRIAFINVNADMPAQWVMGHELLHSIFEEHHDLIGPLMTELRKHTTGFNDFWNEQEDAYREFMGAEYELSHKKAWGELAANYSGDKLMDEEFLLKIAEKDPTMGQKILSALKRILQKLKSIFTPETARFVDDVQSLQDVLAATLAIAAKRNAEGGGKKLAVSKELYLSARSEVKAKKPSKRLTEQLLNIAVYKRERGASTKQKFDRDMRLMLGKKRYEEYRITLEAIWKALERDARGNNRDAAEVTTRKAIKQTETLFRDQLESVDRQLETARRGLEKAGADKKRAIAVKKEFVAFLLKNVAKPVRGHAALLHQLKRANTFAQLESAKVKALDLQEQYHRRQTINTIRLELKKSKVVAKNSRFGPDAQAVLDAMRDASAVFSPDEAERRIEEIERGAEYNDGILTEDEFLRAEALRRVAGLKERETADLDKLLGEVLFIKQEGRAKRKDDEMFRAAEGVMRRGELQRMISGGEYIDPSVAATEGKFEPINTPSKKLKRMIEVGLPELMGLNDMFEVMARLDKTTDQEQSFAHTTYDVHSAQMEENKHRREWSDELQAAVKKAYGLKKSGEIITKIAEMEGEEHLIGKFRNGKGQNVIITMTRAETLKRWMEMQDTTLAETFTLGMAYTPEIFEAIENFVTKEDKALGREMFRIYGKIHPVVNEVFQEIQGFRLPKNPHYSPVRRKGYSSAGKETEFLIEAKGRVATSKSGTKARVVNNLPLMNQSAFVALERHVADMAHYSAWARLIRKMRSDFGNGAIRESIKAYHGDKVYAHLTTMINDLARGSFDTTATHEWWEKLRISFTKSVLAIKPSIMIKQLTSVPAYLENMPTADFVAGLTDFWMNPKRAIRILGSGEYMKARGLTMERDIKDAMNSSAHALYRKHPTALNRLMLNVQLGDQGAIYWGGWALYRYLTKKKGLTHEEALDQFERVTDRTQQSGYMHQQNSWQRGGTIRKLFTMFMSTPMQYLRRYHMAIRTLSTGRGDKKAAVKTILIHQLLLPTIFQFVANAGDWDEEEQLRATLLGPLNGLPILGSMADDVIRTAWNYAIARNTDFDKLKVFGSSGRPSLFSIVDDLKKGMKVLDWDDLTDEQLYGAIRGWAGFIGALPVTGGLPLKQAMDMGRGVVDTLSGEAEGPYEMMGFTPYVAKQAAGG